LPTQTALLAVAALALSTALPAQTTPQAPPQSPTPKPAPKQETRITPEQARELFASVDTILHFDSNDTGLAIHHTVKRRLTTREAVERFLEEKMKEDKDTARMDRSTVVLKKFGLLPRDFDLRPFLLKLLKEQIAGYYDSKTKVVNMLDWVAPDEQKPVLAHELTHALQDQFLAARHVDFDKWGDQSMESTPTNAAEDNHHLAVDESDTAREAAVEGQAMVAYFDWALAPQHTSVRTSPDLVTGADLDAEEGNDPDSPVLSHAPAVLRESLLFPYRDGLRFEQTLLRDHGPQAAFAEVLSRPPETSYEVMHPELYERHVRPTLLPMGDVHSLLDADWQPYDLGVMGELDVKMLGYVLGGAGAAADLAKHWDGGFYYAAGRKDAKSADGSGAAGTGTAGVGLLYLSQWLTAADAQSFAKLYGAALSKKYKQASFQSGSNANELLYVTEEGRVHITVRGREVFVSESFPDALAAQLRERLLGAASSAGGQQPVARAELLSPWVLGLAQAGVVRAARLR
jgi:hypothetical protein